jgi:hypothetical protein
MAYHRGFSSRLNYDDCAYKKELEQSLGCLEYQLTPDMYENCSRCIVDEYPRPFNGNIVDAESELYNLTRPSSKCPTRKYNPNCKKSDKCMSTYDSEVPIVLAPEVCPIVYNNLNWQGGNGIRDPKPAKCRGRKMKN